MDELLQKLNISQSIDIKSIKSELELKQREALEIYHSLQNQKEKSDIEKQREKALDSELELYDEAINKINWAIKAMSVGLSKEKTEPKEEISERIVEKRFEELDIEYNILENAKCMITPELNESIRTYEQCYNAAEEGDSLAQHKLACMYLSGENALKDYVRALTWFRASAEHGNADSMRVLGEFYFTGNHVDKSEVEGLKWFIKAAKLGDRESIHTLIDFYTKKNDFIQLEKVCYLAFRYDQSNIHAINGIIKICSEMNTFKEEKRLYDWCLQVVNNESNEKNIRGDAAYLLGRMFQEGNLAKLDKLQANTWYIKAYNFGNKRAAYYLGELSFNGDGLKEDHSLALKYFLDAVSLEDVKIYRRIADLYRKGKNVEINYQEALNYLKKAVQGGDIEAAYEIGNI